MRKNNWSEEEINFLKENYEMMGPISVSLNLGLTKHCVQHKASSLNLKYQNKTRDELRNDFITKSIFIHGDKYDYTDIDYVNCRTKLKIKCPEHGYFEQYPTSHIIHKQNCPICAKTSMDTEILIKRFIDKHGNKYNYDKVKYTGKDCYVTIGCENHGDFIQRYDSHSNGSGCPICNESKGEKEIEMYLTENNIDFTQQKKFPDCKYKKQLPFDFYLPSLNTCIEFNGKQHYEAVPYWGGDEGFKLRQLRDKIKMEYCHNNNIPLFIIRYDDDIIEQLNKLFKCCVF